MAKTNGELFVELMENSIKSNRIEDAMNIGKVINLSPITIKIGELIIYPKDYTINPYLLPWREYCDGLTEVGGSPPHTHGMVYIDHPSKIKFNSLVTCYGIDWDEESKSYQKYLILEVIKI